MHIKKREVLVAFATIFVNNEVVNSSLDPSTSVSF